MILLAMGVATVLGGGELFVNEAAISALLLASLERTSTSFSPDRIVEALDRRHRRADRRLGVPACPTPS